MGKARYRELAGLVAEAIGNGSLAPGSRLPTHRQFAEQHNVALATATRAYAELARNGLIIGEAGRGVFVRDLGLPLTFSVEPAVSDGLIDLVFNMPGDPADPEILRAGLKRLAMAGDLEAMLRYQPHGGRPHERAIIASHLRQSLGSIAPEDLLITSGAQHGLAISVLGLLRRGDTIGTDALIYPGFKSVAALCGLKLVPIGQKDGSMNPDALARQCYADKLKAIYLMPTVHNPLGTVMDLATRHRLVAVANRRDLLIIEDNAYGFLERDPPPSLLALAPERTIHIGGFSKNLATGLRLGYLISPQCHMDALLHAIRATTWNAPAIISALVTGWIEDGTLEKSEANRRRDGAWRQLLCREVLADISISAHPNASFAWLHLDPGRRAEPIVTELVSQGIAVAAGETFSVSETHPQAIRLAFGGIPKSKLRKALQSVRNAIA